MDLRRQVSRKLPKKKATGFKKRADRKYLIGRTYKDYKASLLENPVAFVVQMDMVYNDESNDPFIQTFKFFRSGLLFALYHTEKTSFSMLKSIELLDSILGELLFQKYIQVLLTDRGAEFSAAQAIENRANATRRTRVYYYDLM